MHRQVVRRRGVPERTSLQPGRLHVRCGSLELQRPVRRPQARRSQLRRLWPRVPKRSGLRERHLLRSQLLRRGLRSQLRMFPEHVHRARVRRRGVPERPTMRGRRVRLLRRFQHLRWRSVRRYPYRLRELRCVQQGVPQRPAMRGLDVLPERLPHPDLQPARGVRSRRVRRREVRRGELRRWKGVLLRLVRVRSRTHRVRRQLRGPRHEPGELRRVRQHLREWPGVRRRKLRSESLHGGTNFVRRIVRRSHHQRGELRSLRRCLRWRQKLRRLSVLLPRGTDALRNSVHQRRH